MTIPREALKDPVVANKATIFRIYALFLDAGPPCSLRGDRRISPSGNPRRTEPSGQNIGQPRFVSRGVRGLGIDTLKEECQGFLLVHEQLH
jgi:hypothetical protein